jgi:hypothetical protein
MNYGVVNDTHAILVAKAVCKSLGNGKNNNADLLIIETACAESQLARYHDDTPDGAGRGLTQVDAGTFYWLKEKALELAPGACMRTKRSWREKILKDFGVDLKRVEHSDLDYNPLLAFIWCRLRYLVVTEAVPKTLDGRALYWKKHYNSYAENAKGTPEHYIQSATKILEL